MTKRFVLSGYFGFKNFGDEEILSVLIRKLQQDKNLVTVISSNPEYTKKQFKHIKSLYTFDIKNITGAIRKSDILVSGGGSLLQDVTSLKSLIYYLLIISIAIFYKKKVIIFAQGIGPINTTIGRILTKYILKKCAYISVRDSKSQELLKSWGIYSDLVCDPIFSSNVYTSDKTNTVVVQLRNFSTMNDSFIKRLAEHICLNFSGKNIEIISFQDNIDLEVCKKLENRIKNQNPSMNTYVLSSLTNQEIIKKISEAQYLIGMRFHSVIIGLLAKCKILTINYDAKVEKLSKEFNLPMLDLRKDFDNQFDELKKQNPDSICKNFDWSGFDNICKD